jgi:hypothetical protein
MTVDLSKLKKGDEVEFRCGGKAVVDSVADAKNPHLDKEIRFGGSLYEYMDYYNNGVRFRHYLGKLGGEQRSPFDIIAIHKKPFDWDTVEAGMAFTCETYARIMHYVGKPTECIYEDDGTVFMQQDGKTFTQRIEREYLTRCPSHDVKVGE